MNQRPSSHRTGCTVRHQLPELARLARFLLRIELRLVRCQSDCHTLGAEQLDFRTHPLHPWVELVRAVAQYMIQRPDHRSDLGLLTRSRQRP